MGDDNMRDYKRPYFTEKHFNITANELKHYPANKLDKQIIGRFLIKMFKSGNAKFDETTFKNKSGVI
jgi:hypothetical protein